MSDTDGPDELAPFRQTLADLLTALRKEAGLTQEQLGLRLGWARATVAGAETGDRLPGEQFWAAANDFLTPRGDLRSAYAQLAAARQDRKQRLARQAEAEREAKVARWRAAHNLPVTSAVPTRDTEAGEEVRQADVERDARADARRTEFGLPPLMSQPAERRQGWPATFEDVAAAGGTPDVPRVAAGLAALRGFCAALPGGKNRQAVETGGAELVSEVRDTALAHRRSYRYLSYEALLPQALAHLAAVIDLRPGWQPSAVRTPLVAAVGEMAALVGALTTLDMRISGVARAISGWR